MAPDIKRSKFLFRPVYDIVFKMVFARNEDLLRSLLTAVLRPKIPIKSVKVLNPEIPPERVDFKGIQLDLHLTLDSGASVIVEMQALNRYNLPSRSAFYVARVTGSTLLRGEDYDQMPEVYGVFFLDYDQVPAHPRFHWTISYHIDQLHERWADHPVIHLVELNKAMEALSSDWPSERGLLQWIQFLKVNSPQDVQRIKDMGGDAAKAASVLEHIMNDPQARDIVDDHVSAMFDHFGSLHAAEQHGHDAGLDEGKKLGLDKGMRVAAIGLTRRGMSAESIADVLGQSLDRVQAWLASTDT